MIKHTFRNFIIPLANLVLEMGLRGVRIDVGKLREFRIQFEKEREGKVREYRRIAARLFNVRERWRSLISEQKVDSERKPRTINSERNKLRKIISSQLNPNSSKSQRELLYGILKLPTQKQRKTKAETVDEEAIVKLQKLKMAKTNPEIAKLLTVILEIREVGKKISTYCLEE